MITIIKELFFKNVYSMESVSEKILAEEKKMKMEKRFQEFFVRESLYLFTVADAFNEMYQKNKETKIILRSFPFLESSKNQIKTLLYGAMNKIPYEKIIEWLSDFFPHGSKEENLRIIINRACDRIAKLRITVDKKDKQRNSSTGNWLDILLSFQSVITNLNTVEKLFRTRYQILIDEQIIEKNEIKRPKFFEEIVNLHMKMEQYYDSNEKIVLLIKKGNTTKEFEDLIRKREENTNLTLEYYKKEREKKIKSISKKSKSKLQEYFKKEDKNMEEIINNLIQIQSMTKVFIIIHHLSRYLEERGLEKSLKDLTSTQKVGLSFTICIAKIVREWIIHHEKVGLSFAFCIAKMVQEWISRHEKKVDMKKEATVGENIKDNICLFGGIIEKIEKTNSSITNKINECVKLMRSDALYTTERKAFIQIFEAFEEKESNYKHDEYIKKFEEEKKQ